MTTYRETQNAIEKWRPGKFEYNALANLTIPLLGLMLLFRTKKVNTIKTYLATLGSHS